MISVSNSQNSLKKLFEHLIQQEVTSQYRQTLENILTTIAANGALWKTFKQWGKENDIIDLNRSDIVGIANIFQNKGLKADQINALRDAILKGTREEEVLKFPKNPFFSPASCPIENPLHMFNSNFLTKCFRKGYKAVQRALGIIRSYESKKSGDLEDYIERLQNNLKVWLLQHLARSSKIPLLEQKGPFHIAPLEYSNSNQSEYYRHDGGAMTLLLIKFLKEKYSFPTSRQYMFEIIKPNCFSSISQVICQKSEIEYSSIELSESTTKDKDNKTNLFIDISISLQNSFAKGKGKEVEKLMKDLCSKANGLGKSVIFGGDVKIEGQNYYVLFSNHDFEIFGRQVKELQGGLGAIPDMAHVQKQLVKEGFPLETLFQHFPAQMLQKKPEKPIKLNGTMSGVTQALEKILDSLSKPREFQTQIAQIYVALFQMQLQTIQTLVQVDKYIRNSNELGPFIQSIESLEKRLSDILQIDQIQEMTPKRKFQEILQEVYLATEEIAFILCFITPDSQCTILKLGHLVQNLSPHNLYKKSYVCTSGMSGYWHVFESLREACPTPKIAFLNTTYYEIVDGQDLGGYLEQFAACEQQDIADLTKKPNEAYDVICMDIYPNFVPLAPVEVPPINQIIENHLDDRPSGKPLTVILDATASFFWDYRIEEFLENFKESIEKGELNLVVITSLAKFAMGGLDKYTGGIVQTYNNFPQDSNYQGVSKKLRNLTRKDRLSIEAENFLSLFMQEDAKWLKDYLESIQRSTGNLYNRLSSLQEEDNPICLCEKDSEIPIIGISFKSIIIRLFGDPEGFDAFLKNEELKIKLTYIMQYFLAAKALACDLPASIRMSFGFPSLNFIECAGTLRMTLGLEDESIIQEYAQMFDFENNEIKKQLVLTESQKEKISCLLNSENHCLAACLELNKVQIIDFAKNHSFIETIEFIYEYSDSRPILQKIIDKIDKNCKNEPFKEFVENEHDTWIEFLKFQPPTLMESYMVNFFWITRFHILISTVYLNKSASENCLTWFEDFQKITLEYAKNHTFNDLKCFAEAMCFNAYKEDKSLFNSSIIDENDGIRFDLPPGLPEVKKPTQFSTIKPTSVAELKKVFDQLVNRTQQGLLTVEETLNFQEKLTETKKTHSDNALISEMEVGAQVLIALHIDSDTIMPKLSTFLLNEEEYQVCLTKGEGACGVHALLGKKIWGSYRFPGNSSTSSARAKKHFTDSLINSLKAADNLAVRQSFVEAISNHFTQADSDRCSKMLFSDTASGQALKAKWEEFHEKYDMILAKAKDQEADLWLSLAETNHRGVMDAVMDEVNEENSRRGVESLYYELDHQQVLEKLRQNPRLLFDIVSANPDGFTERVAEHDNAAAIQQAKQAQNDARKTLEEEETKFITSDALVNHYVEVFNKPEFYLNTAEIKIGAFLFNKEVRVVATQSEGIIPIEDPFNAGSGGDRVVIHHKGAHFSRCVATSDIPKEGPSSLVQPHVKISDEEISALLDNGDGSYQLFNKAENGASFSECQLNRLGAYFKVFGANNSIRNSAAAILGAVAKNQQLPKEAIQGLKFCLQDPSADEIARNGAKLALKSAESNNT